MNVCYIIHRYGWKESHISQTCKPTISSAKSLFFQPKLFWSKWHMHWSITPFYIQKRLGKSLGKSRKVMFRKFILAISLWLYSLLQFLHEIKDVFLLRDMKCTFTKKQRIISCTHNGFFFLKALKLKFCFPYFILIKLA